MSSSSAKRPPDYATKAALIFGSGTLTSRILGLIRDAILFSVMPLDLKDAWFAAFRLPNFFRRILGEGGLSVSFIPVFVKTLNQGDDLAQKRLLDGVFTLLMGVVTAICLLCFLFMEPIVELWLSGPGFSAIPGKIETTIVMARIMIFFLFWVTLFSYFMAVLNGVKKFGLSGMAPLFFNLSIIVLLWLYQNSAQLAVVAAWAVVLGGALQAFFLLPSVYRLGMLPGLTHKIFSPEVRSVLGKFVPTLLGVGVLQIVTLINGYFASQLEPGALSYIYLADRLLELPLSLIAVSLGTAILPTLSQFWASGDQDNFTKCLAKNLRLFQFLVLPCVGGLWFLGEEIVTVLFKRGEFRANEIPVVVSIVQVYCLTLLGAGGVKIINQGYYSRGDTLTPAIIAIVGLVVHVLLAPILMARWGVQGLVLSTSLITVLNFSLCSIWLQWRVQVLPWGQLIGHALFCLIATAGMSGFLLWTKSWGWMQGRFLLDFPVLMLIIAFAGLIYFAISTALGVQEMKTLRSRFMRKRL